MQLVRIQPLFPISPQARSDIWLICMHMYLHRSNQTSRSGHNSRIPTGIQTSVFTVTNPHCPRKWRRGVSFITDNMKTTGFYVVCNSMGQLGSSQCRWNVSSKWNGLRHSKVCFMHHSAHCHISLCVITVYLQKKISSEFYLQNNTLTISLHVNSMQWFPTWGAGHPSVARGAVMQINFSVNIVLF